MELALKKTEKLSSEIIEVRNSAQIKYALLETLFVPDERLKPKIVAEIVSYFEGKFSNPENKIKFFVASQKKKNHRLCFLPNRRRVQKLRDELSYFRLASRSEFRNL